MSQKQRLSVNTATSLINQIVVLICGFILPRLYLVYYGSEVNGLLSSVVQFLSFISLCELGIGAVVQSALYKPLAEKDINQVSRIIISAKRFFKKVACILIIYSILLIFLYPLITHRSYKFLFTATLIIAITMNSFAQYYFGIINQLLLNADQRSYVQLICNICALCINIVLCYMLMKNKQPIQIVQLTTSVVFLMRPIAMWIYVKKHYVINYSIELSEEPIKQKWNGIAQHIAAVILGNTDVVVLTLMSTLANVSIYSIYYMVVAGVKQLIMSLITGMQALMGDLLAKNEMQALNSTFERFELILHTIVTLLFTGTGLLIIPFIKVYTNGISDVDYIVPLFAVMITFAQASYCLRLPYNMLVLAAGHYKQTQWSAIIEAALNVVLSVVMVSKFGLIGVAIGTLAAMIYRTFYLAYYISHNIIYKNFYSFLKHVLVDLTCVVVMVGSTFWIELDKVSYLSWIWMAVKVMAICCIESLVINLAYYKELTLEMLKLLPKTNVMLEELK